MKKISVLVGTLVFLGGFGAAYSSASKSTADPIIGDAYLDGDCETVIDQCDGGEEPCMFQLNPTTQVQLKWQEEDEEGNPTGDCVIPAYRE